MVIKMSVMLSIMVINAEVEGFATKTAGVVNKLLTSDGQVAMNTKADYSTQFSAGRLPCDGKRDSVYSLTAAFIIKSGPDRGIQNFEFGCASKSFSESSEF